MVRTADMAIKTGGKNSKSRSSNPTRSRSPSSSSTDRGYSSYNTVCPRETPTWQKPITMFFQNIEKSKTDNPEEPLVSTNAQNGTHEDSMEEDIPISRGGQIKVVEPNPTNGEADTEMQEEFVNATKIRRCEEDHNIAPKKKRKLDSNIYANLEILEK